MASKVENGIKSFFNIKEEKEACGVGFIVSIDGIASHKVSLFCITSNLSDVIDVISIM